MRARLMFAGLTLVLVAAVGVHTGAQTPGTPTERKLELTFDGKGYATLVAQNVSVSDVFAEWARVGGSKILNAEKLPRGLIFVQFDKTPEQKLVESLVRLSKAQNAGSIVAPRRLDGPVTPSRLEVINILPTSAPTQSYTTTSSNVAPLYPQNSSDDEVPPVMPVVGGGPASPPPPQPQNTAGRGPGSPVPLVGPPGTGRTGGPTPLPGTTGRGGGGA
jgi:hypothetical protein